MYDECIVLASSPQKTALAGRSLAASLSVFPVTVALAGPLGAGKTTFTQGFAEGLGIHDAVTSPTYAIEQRYHTAHGPFVHVDCYRLPEADLPEVLRSTEDAAIRVIEWSDRLPSSALAGIPLITVTIEEPTPETRRLRFSFNDSPVPTREDILAWRKSVLLPEHVGKHCDAVAAIACSLGQQLNGKGVPVRLSALRRAGEAHDLLRFIDFRPNAGPSQFQDSPEAIQTWATWKKRYAGLHHEAAAGRFLAEQNYPLVSRIVETHGMRLPHEARSMIEQKLLYYADKVSIGDRRVTVEERFADFRERYGKTEDAMDAEAWYKEVKETERELFNM